MNDKFKSVDDKNDKNDKEITIKDDTIYRRIINNKNNLLSSITLVDCFNKNPNIAGMDFNKTLTINYINFYHSYTNAYDENFVSNGNKNLHENNNSIVDVNGVSFKLNSDKKKIKNYQCIFEYDTNNNKNNLRTSIYNTKKYIRLYVDIDKNEYNFVFDFTISDFNIYFIKFFFNMFRKFNIFVLKKIQTNDPINIDIKFGDMFLIEESMYNVDKDAPKNAFSRSHFIKYLTSNYKKLYEKAYEKL
jgi:hypothetical protein